MARKPAGRTGEPRTSPRSSKSAGRCTFRTRAARSYTPYGVRTGRQVVQLRDGLLQERGVNGNSRQAGTRKVLPAMLHVAVADGRVFIRGEQSVLSLDLRKLSGGWESVPLPMVRRLGNLPNVGYYYSSGMAQIGDNGRYALTVGGGKVFTVYDFLPSNNNLSIVRQRMGNVKGLDEGSRMAGLSIKGQCMVLWTLGRGDGDADVLRGGMFLTAPTYAAGRLYAVVYYLQSYVLVCLDAETGKLIWRSPIAQAPARRRVQPVPAGRRRARWRWAAPRPSPTAGCTSRPTPAPSPPWTPRRASRSGAISTTARSTRPRGGVSGRRRSRGRTVWTPGNPLVVSHGLVVCLPADCDDVLALRRRHGQARVVDEPAGPVRPDGHRPRPCAAERPGAVRVLDCRRREAEAGGTRTWTFTAGPR